jgi:Uma2 family endonuclease
MVVLSAKALPEVRFSIEEYLQADLPEGYNYELVEGEVEVTPAPDPDHEDTNALLTQALYRYGEAHPEAFAKIIHHAAVLIPGKTTVREPDLSVYAEWIPRGKGWKGWKEYTPFLVAEIVSPGQASRDYTDKRKDYWLASIEEYWIVDPRERQVTVFNRGVRIWKKAVFQAGQSARSTVLPGFSIPVKQLCP